MGFSDFEDIENDGDRSPELDIGKDEYILHGASVFFHSPAESSCDV